jgi:rare lipoprotein A
MKITLPINGTESRISPKKEKPAVGAETGRGFAEVLKSGVETPPPGKKESSHPVEYVVQPGDTLWKIGKAFANNNPAQIARDNGLSNPDLIFPGQKLLIYPSAAKTEQPRVLNSVAASWYGEEHHQKVTASGQRFDMNRNTLAHNTLPFGTRVRLFNRENGKSAEGVVNDRGPYLKGREVDVSYALAKKLGFVRKGVTKLDIEIM